MPTSRRPLRVLHSLVAGVTLAVITVPLFVAGDPDPVEARRGYGRKYNYSAYIARCKNGCVRTAGAIKRCIQRNVLAPGVRECQNLLTQQQADCAGDGTCKRAARRAYRSCKAQKVEVARADLRDITGRRYGVKRCGGCCQRTRGQGSCQNYFRKSRWYGSYRRYGRVFCNRNDVPPPGSPSGAFANGYSDRIRARLAELVPFLTSGWSR